MKWLQKTPVIRVLAPFSVGGMVGYLQWIELPVRSLIAGCSLLWTICLLIYFTANPVRLRIRKYQPFNRLLQRAAFSALFLGVGFATGILRHPAEPLLPTGNPAMVRGRLLEEPVPASSGNRAGFRISELATADTLIRRAVKVIAYFGTPGSVPFQAGEQVEMYGFLYPVRNPGNPGATDFASILHRKGIWYRFYAEPGFPPFHLCKKDKWRPFRAVSIREAIRGHWHGDSQEASLLSAVCLGERKGLSEEVKYSFLLAGGMHLLAVSGLHVGLIWWVLQHALSWLSRITGREVYRTVTLVALLWIYAYVTGFSTSVSRAVTMFSLFSLGKMLDQRMDPVNGVLVSALFLLLINPGKLLEAGFQLSYAGVLGIVTTFPFLKDVIRTQWRLINWVWQATAAGLAAQVATLPLVVYHFGQFPLYAPLTNLLAIPLLSLIVGLFILSLPFLAAGVLSGIFNGLLHLAARAMIRCMGAIGSLPFSLIGDLELDISTLWLLLAAVLSIMVLARIRERVAVICLAGSLCCTFGWSTWLYGARGRESGMVVAHFRQASLISFRAGRRVDHFVWCRDSLSAGYIEHYLAEAWNSRQYDVSTYMVGDSLSVTGQTAVVVPLTGGVWMAGNREYYGLVIGGHPGRLPDWAFKVPDLNFVLLHEEPVLPHGWLETSDRPYPLIVDGSNHNWYVQKAGSQNNKVYITGRLGAFSKRW